MKENNNTNNHNCDTDKLIAAVDKMAAEENDKKCKLGIERVKQYLLRVKTSN